MTETCPKAAWIVNLFLVVFLLPALAFAQSATTTMQNPVTPGHLPTIVTNGIIKDAGSAFPPLTTARPGVVSNNQQTDCIYNAAVSGPYNSLCFGVTSSGAYLTLQGYNGASTLPLNFVVNGSTIPFPGPAGPYIPIAGGTATGAVQFNGGALLPAGSGAVQIQSSFFGIEAPETAAATSGAGSVASPFTSSDGTAGIASVLTGLGSRCGQVSFGAAAYTMTSGVTVSTAGCALVGTGAGFNKDPNGSTKGTYSTTITTPGAAAGFTISNASNRVYSFKANGLYLYGGGNAGDGSSAIKIAGAGGGLQGGWFEDISTSNVNYGLYVGAQMDAPFISNFYALYDGYGIYGTGSSAMPGAQIIAPGISDNNNGGFSDLSTGDGPAIMGGLFWRNANVLTTHGANLSINSGGGTYIGTYARDPGLNFLTSGQVAADDYYISGGLNFFLGTKARGAPSGNSGWHLASTARYNQLIAPFGLFNTSQDVLLDSGALQNVIFSPGPITITDNSAQINYFDYLDNATRVRHIKNGGTPILSLDAQGGEPYGLFINLNATADTNGRNFAVASEAAGNQISGGGYFAVVDATALGRDDFTIDQYGVARFPVGQDVIFSSGTALATNAIFGFPAIPTMAGIATGQPALHATAIAQLAWDTSDTMLLAYNNPTSTWRPVGAYLKAASGWAPFGATQNFDSTGLTNGHNYGFISSAASAGDGQGDFCLFDSSGGGVDRWCVSPTGTFTVPGGTQIGVTSLNITVGEFGLAKTTGTSNAPGAAGGAIMLVCGTNSGTAKLIAYAGTSSTPATILDNIGSGVTGC